MAKVLYLTQDGITDHIGQAQIAPYLLALAAEGHDIHIVSAEKPNRDRLKTRYEQRFRAAGMKWTSVLYANRPPLVSSFITLWRMYVRAKAVAAAERPDIIHCRTYLPLEIAVRLKKLAGAKLLVDFRDFWPDVGIEKKPFKFVYRELKRREPGYFQAADHVVTLTAKASAILQSRHPGAVDGDRHNYTVIPCCADFDQFDPTRIDPGKLEGHRQRLGLGGSTVLLYLGSLGHDYLIDQMMRLFGALRELRPDSKFLFVSNNADEQVERARLEAGIPPDAIKVVSVDRDEVPEHIALADLSVIFIRPTMSKAGCSPTKLAELLACNVPIIANAGVGDMDSIIDFENNGSVLVHDFTAETLRGAVERILSLPHHQKQLIRDRSREFSLGEGVRRYAGIYARLTPTPVLEP